jgi:ribosomal protein S18 acetylase RimI-like enzyme
VNLRRLEEIGLNASGPANPRLFDGWLLGFQHGKSKRVRSVNPFFGSSLPLPMKIETCRRLYDAAGLPCIVRLTPFAQPPELEDWLITQGYERFDDTLVMVKALESAPPAPDKRRAPRCVEFDLYDWNLRTQDVRDLSDDQVRRLLDRQELLRLDGCGYVIALESVPVAWGVTLIEDGWAGIYTVETGTDHRRAGHARRIVLTLLDWAHRRGAAAAYLQVTAQNSGAIALYESLGFTEAYRYWYRALPQVIANERR